jgi:hypothetical protein
MRVLHLFAGAGGSVLAGRMLGWESVGAVELDPYCCKVLEKHGERVLARDICTFDARPLRGQVDVVVGGWPCQDLSVAGKRAGLAGERSGLFWQMLRVIDECCAQKVFAENVPGLLGSHDGRDFGAVLAALATRGFDAKWTVLGAHHVGAPHRRNRVWILAHRNEVQGGSTATRGGCGDALPLANSGGGDSPQRDAFTCIPSGFQGGPAGRGGCGDGVVVGNPEHPGLERWRACPGYAGQIQVGATGVEGRQPAETQRGLGGDVDGVARRMDPTSPPTGTSAAEAPRWPAGRGQPQHPFEPPRITAGYRGDNRVPRLKSIGNGWVPQCAVLAWSVLNG